MNVCQPLLYQLHRSILSPSSSIRNVHRPDKPTALVRGIKLHFDVALHEFPNGKVVGFLSEGLGFFEDLVSVGTALAECRSGGARGADSDEDECQGLVLLC